MRQPLVAGNWKMHGSLASINALIAGIKEGLAGLKAARVAVCPPYVYLPEVSSLAAGTTLAIGAQNVSHEIQGAFTGEISCGMLLDFGCQYAIVGHSERRSLYCESDAVVAKKFAAAVKAGLAPILCVGETLQEREANQTEQVVARQLDAVLEQAGVASFAQAVIAYEPVWAIGTGRTATPQQAQDVHSFIRGRLDRHDTVIARRMQILYGGSVKAGNAVELFAQADIDGGLIGGASLDASEFLAVCRAADNQVK